MTSSRPKLLVHIAKLDYMQQLQNNFFCIATLPMQPNMALAVRWKARLDFSVEILKVRKLTIVTPRYFISLTPDAQGPTRFTHRFRQQNYIRVFHRRVFYTCWLVLHFPVLHFSPLRSGAPFLLRDWSYSQAAKAAYAIMWRLSVCLSATSVRVL